MILPDTILTYADKQSGIPLLAKNEAAMRQIAELLRQVPTHHDLRLGDARIMPKLAKDSVHLVVTSPPYWNLKKYNDDKDQLGHVGSYEEFLEELDKVWRRCYEALVPGGRLVCVVGDVCLSRRKNGGRHTVVPLHASILERCRASGFDNLTPIIWHKIANAQTEAAGNGAGFLGKPYEPNGVVKNDIEFILMQRKPGGYRTPSRQERLLSVISEADHRRWFQPIWSDVPGERSGKHPAPYPVELASRLIRMFSFAGDTVLDPFAGTGTTSLAASLCGRSSIGYEIDAAYLELAKQRLA